MEGDLLVVRGTADVIKNKADEAQKAKSVAFMMEEPSKIEQCAEKEEWKA
jgi:hypothetical protein